MDNAFKIRNWFITALITWSQYAQGPGW
jgi:hypothetical protein